MRWHLNPGEAEYHPDPAARPSRLQAAEGTRVLFIFPDFLAKLGKSAETQCGIGQGEMLVWKALQCPLPL